MDAVLSDRERGGFYASQDADESLDDDGDYFTWTQKEAAAVLTPEEMEVAAVYYDIGELGDMHHNPQKNTLHIDHSLAEVARRTAVSVEQAAELLQSAKKKLYAARLQRPMPFVDKTIYVNWNSLAISAYLDAARALELVSRCINCRVVKCMKLPRKRVNAPCANLCSEILESARRFALFSLDRILRESWHVDGSLDRVVAYADGKHPSTAVAGMLDDYAALGLACLDAWESTVQLHYCHKAERVADAMVARFSSSHP